MNGFDNIKDRVKLRHQFKDEAGTNWENSQGEPDIDYVLWLENKVISMTEKECIKVKALGTITAAINTLRDLTPENLKEVTANKCVCNVTNGERCVNCGKIVDQWKNR